MRVFFKFEDLKPIEDFITCVEAFGPKAEAVYLSYNQGALHFSFWSPQGSVFYETPLDYADKFSFGVNAKDFCKSVKKAFHSSIEFSTNKSKLILKEKNTKVSLPTQIFQRFFPPKDQISLPHEVSVFIKNELPSIAANVREGKNPKFPGVILDSTPGFLCLGNFSDVAIRLSTLKLDENFGRSVIPPELAKLCKIKDPGASTILCENSFGFQLESGVCAFSPLLSDTYPQGYFEPLGLRKNVDLIDSDKYNVYSFDAAHLLYIVDQISGVLGAEEVSTQFSVKGQDKENNPIWAISSRNFNGFGVEEVVSSTGEVREVFFSVNRDNLKSFLSSYEEDILFLFEDGGNSVILGNEDRTKILILLKAG